MQDPNPISESFARADPRRRSSTRRAFPSKTTSPVTSCLPTSVSPSLCEEDPLAALTPRNCTPHGVGGAERVLADLANAQYPGWEQLIINVAGDNLDLAAACGNAPLYMGPSPRQNFQALRHALHSVISYFRPDIVHAHLPAAILAVSSLRHTDGAVLLATHHHGDHFVAGERRIAALIDRLAGSRFDTVVAPSEGVRDFLIRTYGYAPQTYVNTKRWALRPL